MASALRGWRRSLVEAHPVRGLMLISGPVDAARADPPRRRPHHDVLAGCWTEAVLPFRFGTVVPGLIWSWLDRRWRRVHAAQSELRRHLEMSVRLLSLHGERSGPGRCSGDAERLVEQAGMPDWRYYRTGHGANVAASLAFLVPRDGVATSWPVWRPSPPARAAWPSYPQGRGPPTRSRLRSGSLARIVPVPA